MSILLWIIVGGIAGWLASLVMHTDASQGILLNIVVGIVGAFLGGFLFSLLGAAPVTGFNIYSVLVATVGAIVLIGLYKMMARA